MVPEGNSFINWRNTTLWYTECPFLISDGLNAIEYSLKLENNLDCAMVKSTESNRLSDQ